MSNKNNGRMDRRGVMRLGLVAGAGLVGLGSGRQAFGHAFLRRTSLLPNDYQESYLTEGITTYTSSGQKTYSDSKSSVDGDCSQTQTYSTSWEWSGHTERSWTNWEYEVCQPDPEPGGVLDMGLGHAPDASRSVAFAAPFMKSAAPAAGDWVDVTVEDGWTVQSKTMCVDNPSDGGVITTTATKVPGDPTGGINDYWEHKEQICQTDWRTLECGVSDSSGCDKKGSRGPTSLDLGLRR